MFNLRVASGPVILGSLCTAVAATVLLMPISAWRIQRENRVVASMGPQPNDVG